MDKEWISAIIFLLISLSFYTSTMRHTDQMLNNDQQKLDKNVDIDYERMRWEAQEYGFEGSRLQKYIDRYKPH